MVEVKKYGEGVQADGKGVYIGDTLRSMYKRAKEHRCRIPRLKIDLEGWKGSNLPVSKKVTILEDVKEAEEDLEKTVETLEGNSRRMETKRKLDDISKRKSKRMKYDRLEGWGETEFENSSQLELPEGWIMEAGSRFGSKS